MPIQKIEGVTATYSAEDNSLRLYSENWLDKDDYLKVNEAGFKWAPKQNLYVAKKWTPTREDFALAIAGEITAEQSTMVDRAEAKAERLEALADKRALQANQFHDAANAISQRFEYGQPILVGHHSERKARKDKDRMNSAMDKSAECAQAVDYWNYRAAGVERHADRKNNSGVRARRIKTLLAELRDHQRTINTFAKNLTIWQHIATVKDETKFKSLVESYCGHHQTQAFDCWSELRDGKITHKEICEKSIAIYEKRVAGVYQLRWVSHILNRLGYEKSFMADTSKHDGELSAVILQAFAREHGADKPKAKNDGDNWTLSSVAPLPLHIGESESLTLSSDKWRELMQACGYAVVIKEKRVGKKQVCSLINPTPEQALKLQKLWNEYALTSKFGTCSEIREMGQSHYSANSGGDYGRYSTISLSADGSRVWPTWKRKEAQHDPVCRVRVGSSTGGGLYGADSVIIVIDKAQKALPFDLDALITEAIKAKEIAIAERNEAA